MAMATIYPEHQRYHEPESEAERHLYPLLAELPAEFTVDTADLRRELSSLLSQLTSSGVTADQVTVLTGSSTSTSVLARHAKEPLGEFRLTGKPTRVNDIRFESVYRFKGLEAPVVVSARRVGSGPRRSASSGTPGSPGPRWGCSCSRVETPVRTWTPSSAASWRTEARQRFRSARSASRAGVS